MDERLFGAKGYSMKRSNSDRHGLRPGSGFDWRKALEGQGPVAASAPCRVDFGGTLDLRTFSYPLQPLGPCTFNLALDLRTTARLEPYARGRIKVSSRGFRAAEFAGDAAPFRHPLGLMFAVAAFFGADGVHIRIDSESPPRSALGGSSVAAVALVRAFFETARHGARADRRAMALTAHAIEESVAGVPCGYQDQLAAAFAGASLWRWVALPRAGVYVREVVVAPARLSSMADHLLVAYAGVTHASSDVNGQWVRQFLDGRHRSGWTDIIAGTRAFADCLRAGRWGQAAELMQLETEIRRRMTPDVLEPLGRRLVAAARRSGCGARFTGAGGGGCLWALGEAEAIQRLAPVWRDILARRPGARLLSAPPTAEGLRVEAPR
jgi:D-glycero-alpha-D-manno-heptose-7-phosphate kinase